MAEEVGMTQPVVVIAPATHDTASAVAAVPAAGSPVIIRTTRLVLPELGNLVASGCGSAASRDQRRNDAV